MPDFAAYVIVGGVAAGVTLIATPLVRLWALRLGWVVQPDERRVHTQPTAAVGGVAMFLGFLAAMAVAWNMDRFGPLFVNNSEPLGVVLGAIVIFAVGLADDLKKSTTRIGPADGISAPAKVTGMVVAGAVLAYFGVTMFYFRIPFFDVVTIGQDLAPLVTVLWLIGLANAINLIDGLDGLAAGIVAIAAGAFFLYSVKLSALDLLTQPNFGPLVAIIAVGGCVGFLPHNFNPARIIMGDSGALLLGLLLAVSSSLVGGRAEASQEFTGQTYFFLAPLVIPLLVLGVPIFDMAFAIVRRAGRRSGVAVADKGHLHHRLMNLGHGHRRSVLILWAWTALLSGFVLYPTLTGSNPAYLPFAMAALAIVLY